MTPLDYVITYYTIKVVVAEHEGFFFFFVFKREEGRVVQILPHVLLRALAGSRIVLIREHYCFFFSKKKSFYDRGEGSNFSRYTQSPPRTHVYFTV